MASINGTLGNDNLIGTLETDSIFGDLGDDTLYSSGGDEFVFNNVIDVLVFDSGVYVYSTDGFDIIKDFDHGSVSALTVSNEFESLKPKKKYKKYTDKTKTVRDVSDDSVISIDPVNYNLIHVKINTSITQAAFF